MNSVHKTINSKHNIMFVILFFSYLQCLKAGEDYVVKIQVKLLSTLSALYLTPWT